MGHTKPAPANNTSVDGPVHNLALLVRCLEKISLKYSPNDGLMMVYHGTRWAPYQL